MPPPHPPAVGRRAFLGTLLGSAAAVGLGACAKGGAEDVLAAAAPVPSEVDRTTSLTISIRRTRIQLEGAGLIDQVPFTVKEWANLEAGPDVIQGFRARSVDLANNAGVPPIQARAIN